MARIAASRAVFRMVQEVFNVHLVCSARLVKLKMVRVQQHWSHAPPIKSKEVCRVVRMMVEAGSGVHQASNAKRVEVSVSEVVADLQKADLRRQGEKDLATKARWQWYQHPC